MTPCKHSRHRRPATTDTTSCHATCKAYIAFDQAKEQERQERVDAYRAEPEGRRIEAIRKKATKDHKRKGGAI